MAVIKHPLEAPGLLMDDTSTRIAAMDSAGHRRRGAQHQSLLVPRRARRGGRADPAAERDAGRVLRQPARPLRRLRDGGAAASRAGRRAGRARGEEARLPRRRRRRQRRRPGTGRPEVPSRSGRSARSSACWCSCTRSARASWSRAAGSAAAACLTNTIGNPLETTIALSHLIFEGTLDRFPGLKICAAHGGGFLPSYANRSDAVIRTFPDRVGPLPKKKPTAYLRDGQLYFDTIVFTPRGAAPPDRRDRRRPDHDRHRLSVPVDQPPRSTSCCRRRA